MPKELPQYDGRLFISDYNLTDFRPIQQDTAQSGKIYTRSTGVQRYDVEIKVQAFGASYVRLMQAFLAEHVETPFIVRLPTCINNITLNAIVGTDVQARRSEIPVSAFKGAFEVGDYITFGSHSKVYTVLEPLQKAGTLKISPPLRQDIKAKDFITPQHINEPVPLLVRTVQNETVTKVDVYWEAEFTLKLKEAF